MTGSNGLYKGEWARKFVKEANRRGGRVSLEDLAEYTPRWDEPVRFTYRGHEVVGSPAPDTGGLFIGYALNVLEPFDLKTKGPYTKSADTLEIMARAFGRTEQETRWAIQDPLNFKLPTALWLSQVRTLPPARVSCKPSGRRCTLGSAPRRGVPVGR
jgi:gamma-glutamyltranspeptidase/glutathione hydrolase